jgi:PIN domain nuclease of toxin-antitoxin system
VRLLLDTHALLWWLIDDPQLSPAARAAVASLENEVFVSACSGYEIAYKQNLGRFPTFPESLLDRVGRERIETLPISLEHAVAAAALPGPHRDPWDRIMMAQALAEHCHMVTVDKVFAEYNVPVLW